MNETSNTSNTDRVEPDTSSPALDMGHNEHHFSRVSAHSNAIVAACTFILTIVAVLQGIQIFKNEEDTRKLLDTLAHQADALRSSAEHSQLQAQAARKQADAFEAQIQQLRRQTETAQLSAELAKKSIQTSLALFEKQYRPWLDFGDVSHPAVGQPIRLMVKNVGRGPALKVFTSVRAFSQLSTAIPPTVGTVRRDVGSDTVLLPGVAMRMTVPISWLTRDEWALIESGKKTFYIHGFIEYLDEFEHRHQTTSCLFYDLPTRALSNCGSGSSAN